jgi:phosphatidylinositol alpha-1,6-mannosyltransferase
VTNRASLEAATKLAGRPLFLGAALMEAGRGGIARVARLTAQSLLSGGARLEMLSLIDRLPVEIDGRSVATALGSTLLFAVRCQLAAFKPRHFIYDSGGVARAHLKLGALTRPYAVWMHGIEVWEGIRAGAHRAIRAADLRIVNSTFTLNRFHELHGGGTAATVCWLATEEDAPPTEKPSFSGRPTVLILGRIDKTERYKGHQELVGVWPKVVSAVPEARLLIAGQGPGLEELRAVAKISPVARHIEFTGFVSEQDLPSIWQRTHLFAMPSRKEGFGLVYVEAMRYGLPVIASVHDAGQEVNVHDVTGRNVDLDRRGELEESVIALLRSPDLMKRMGHAGHERWRENFCQSSFAAGCSPSSQNSSGTDRE